jgi:hypothetical protein
MLLHKDKEAFKEIVIATAMYFSLQNFQVEKDYYVSLFLNEMAKQDIPVVFKGGTSLSKCYDLIDRFSEDIDLAVNFNSTKAGKRLRKRLKEAIVQAIYNLDFKFGNEKEVESNKDYNMYKVEYDKQFSGHTTMVDYIIVETIVVYKPYPTKTHLVSNYIIKYLERKNELTLINQYELKPFMMQIQTIERTFIDKLFALCDYHITEKYYRYSRHLYDIHKIWISKKLDIKLVKDIMNDVIADRSQFGTQNHSVKPGTMINSILQEIIDANVYEKDFNEVTKEFLFTETSYDELIISLQQIIDDKIMPDKINVKID